MEVSKMSCHYYGGSRELPLSLAGEKMLTVLAVTARDPKPHMWHGLPVPQSLGFGIFAGNRAVLRLELRALWVLSTQSTTELQSHP